MVLLSKGPRMQMRSLALCPSEGMGGACILRVKLLCAYESRQSW